jgi:hypothetical protein
LPLPDVSPQSSSERALPAPEEKRALLDAYRRRYALTTLVETGTLFGDTVEAMRTKFARVVSVELSEELAARARERFSGIANVTILQGDSGDLLPPIAGDLDGPALFWLDGHFSGEFHSQTRGHVATARGVLQTPVVRELLAVLARPGRGHVVLIDDARLFDGTNDYPTLDAVRALVAKHDASLAVTVERDVIRIVPPARVND